MSNVEDRENGTWEKTDDDGYIATHLSVCPVIANEIVIGNHLLGSVNAVVAPCDITICDDDNALEAKCK